MNTMRIVVLTQCLMRARVSITCRSITCRHMSHILSTYPCVGAGVETNKKMNAGSYKNAHGPTKNLQKLENETEVFQHETVSSELKKQIQQARLAKKMTQAQVAQAINEKPQIINEYESGKAIPNPQILSKLSRVLGVKLKKNPGKK